MMQKTLPAPEKQFSGDSEKGGINLEKASLGQINPITSMPDRRRPGDVQFTAINTRGVPNARERKIDVSINVLSL